MCCSAVSRLVCQFFQKYRQFGLWTQVLCATDLLQRNVSFLFTNLTLAQRWVNGVARLVYCLFLLHFYIIARSRQILPGLAPSYYLTNERSKKHLDFAGFEARSSGVSLTNMTPTLMPKVFSSNCILWSLLYEVVLRFSRIQQRFHFGWAARWSRNRHLLSKMMDRLSGDFHTLEIYMNHKFSGPIRQSQLCW